MISYAIQSTELRSWGHKLKQASNKDDPGLVYLREARNVAEHGLEPFARFEDAFVSVANGAFAISGNSNVYFSGNIVNGVDTGIFNLSTNNGKIEDIIGKPNTAISESPAKINLVAVTNPEKKNLRVEPPNSIFGQVIFEGSPKSLAGLALNGLQERFKDFRDQLTR